MALTANVRGVEVNNRPLVSARVPSFDKNRPLQLLLDTGSEGAYLVARHEPERDLAGGTVGQILSRAGLTNPKRKKRRATPSSPHWLRGSEATICVRFHRHIQ